MSLLEKLERGYRFELYGLPYTVEWLDEDEIRASTMAGNTVQFNFEVAKVLMEEGSMRELPDAV